MDNKKVKNIEDIYLEELSSMKEGIKDVLIGDEGIGDVTSIMEHFGIKSDEFILAYIPNRNVLSSFFSSSANFVITNKAIYKKPEVVRNFFRKVQKDNMVIRIEELPQYVVVVDSFSVEAISLDNVSKNLFTTGLIDSVFRDNHLLEEVCMIINKIQGLQYEYGVDREGRERLVSWVKKEAESEIDNNGLKKTEKLVEALKKESPFSYEMYLLLIKNAILRCNRSKFLKTIADISHGVFDEKNTKKIIEEMQTQISNMRKDIAFPESIGQEKISTLSSAIIENLKSDNEDLTFEDEQFKTLLYAFNINEAMIVLNANPQVDDSILNKIINWETALFGDIEEIKKTQAYLRNQTMLEVINEIKSGSVDPEKGVWVDCIGLNGVFYAVLLGNIETIEAFSEKEEGMFVKCPLPQMKGMFDCATLALYRGIQIEVVKNLLRTGDSEIRNLQKTIDATYFKIELNEKSKSLGEFTRKNLRHSLDAAKKEGDYDRILSVEQELADLEERYDRINERIDEYEKLIGELEDEISELLEYKLHKYRHAADEFKEDNSTFARFIKYLFEKPSYVDEFLSYKYDDFIICGDKENGYFSIPKLLYEKFVNVENKSEEAKKEEEKTKEDVAYEKPFGNSWFSDKAHTDIKLLQKEYRQYAKKYHPDNQNGNVKIYLDIQEERRSIIEGLE